MSPRPVTRPIDASARREPTSYVNVLVLASLFGAVAVPMAVMLPAPSYTYWPEPHSVRLPSDVSLRASAEGRRGATFSGVPRGVPEGTSRIDSTAGSPASVVAARTGRT